MIAVKSLAWTAAIARRMLGGGDRVMSFTLVHVLPILLALSGSDTPPSGAALYRERCSTCHGPQGAGLAGVVPPLV